MKAKHDIPSVNGFDIDPIQLAHDLTMLKLYKSDFEIPEHSDELYELYISQLTPIREEINDRTRFDLFNSNS
ncbi:TPA: hypothetical protein IU311_001765 [Enterococcus faecalis]|uniref:Uncharacterized protein n=1 Tax=Enterococcus faecalis TaxID=1351 RepID=A0ABD7XRT6_ENTFL|nr:MULTISPECIES: hypothetical protein [Enterococcus]EKX6153111.1 hypothetical protein [Pseudomonas aeruginosa]MBU5554176.1 hypothetical protein [Enterococcus sp. S157_ASV_20]MBU5559292.1 hypothetical protein [Enterococcus sp. S115_ASV_20]MBU5577770.1 hypothetical protein [Enterococcus sp. S131_ASV_20]CPW56832.1 Uncharacterised protein [Mycobacteroides abscessus]